MDLKSSQSLKVQKVMQVLHRFPRILPPVPIVFMIYLIQATDGMGILLLTVQTAGRDLRLSVPFPMTGRTQL